MTEIAFEPGKHKTKMGADRSEFLAEKARAPARRQRVLPFRHCILSLSWRRVKDSELFCSSD